MTCTHDGESVECVVAADLALVVDEDEETTETWADHLVVMRMTLVNPVHYFGADVPEVSAAVTRNG